MNKLINENLKWIIAGISCIWIVASMATCTKSNATVNAKTDAIALEKGYIQQRNGSFAIWIKPKGK